MKFIYLRDEEKYTPLHEAAYSRNLKLPKYLIKECRVDITLLT